MDHTELPPLFPPLPTCHHNNTFVKSPISGPHKKKKTLLTYMKNKIKRKNHFKDIPEFGYQMVYQDQHLKLGKFISRTSMDSIAKWNESIGFRRNLHLSNIHPQTGLETCTLFTDQWLTNTCVSVYLIKRVIYSIILEIYPILHQFLFFSILNFVNKIIFLLILN